MKPCGLGGRARGCCGHHCLAGDLQTPASNKFNLGLGGAIFVFATLFHPLFGGKKGLTLLPQQLYSLEAMIQCFCFLSCLGEWG